MATPGRLIDMLEAGKTNLRRVTYLVLDEARACAPRALQCILRARAPPLPRFRLAHLLMDATLCVGCADGWYRRTACWTWGSNRKSE